MFCPVCKSEYEPWIVTCPNDQVNLVDHLEPEGDSSEARLVTLHTLSTRSEAEMVQDILAQNDIRSIIQSGPADSVSSMMPGAAIMVDERDIDRAQELYTSLFGEDTSPLTGPADDEEDAE